jgi:putative ABC transport system permease protein
VTREIVGVVGDVRSAGLDSEPRPEIFLPHAQNPSGSMTFVVRMGTDPQQLLPAIQRAVREIEPSQSFTTTATLDQLVARTLAVRRFSLLLLGLFSSIALILAVVGIYGTISFSTAQRKREIGIRMALGAQTGDILRMVLREGTSLALAGVALGALFAALVTRYLGSLLYGVSATDPATFGTLSLFLVLVAIVASYLPARSAARENPLNALRPG